MKKLTIILLWLIGVSLSAQINLTIEGVDTTLNTTDGYNIARSSPTNLIFRNNLLLPTQTSGYTLQCGDDTYISAWANNLDGAIISGNKLYTTTGRGSHGMMAGFNIDYHIRHNYIDGIPYGVVTKSSVEMTYTEGGIYYNIFKSNATGPILLRGISNIPVYNNTFYSSRSASSANPIVRIEYGGGYITDSIKIKNNIFYATRNEYVIAVESSALSTLQCDYNVYYIADGDHQPLFYNITTSTAYTLSQWQALGFDENSVVVNPNFNDTINFVPALRLDYGTNLGTDYDDGLSTTAAWVVGTAPATVQQGATWQVGAVLYTTSSIYEADHYVATDGSNSNPGTYEQPWLTFNYAATQATAGDTVYFRGGTYPLASQVTFSNNGTAGNPICFFNYPGETPVFDAAGGVSNTAAIFLNSRSYINLRGLTVCNVRQTTEATNAVGFYSYFSNHINFTNCVSHDIGVRAFFCWASDEITYRNCDAYNVNDSLSADPGQHGDGWLVFDRHSATYSSDTTLNVYFHNCRAWNCTDDGWDAETEGRIELDSCWAWNNGRSGFKLGLARVTSDNVGKIVTNCVAMYNAIGFNTNDNDCAAKLMYFYNNTSYHNNYGFFIENTIESDARELRRIFRNNISYASNTLNIAPYGSYTHSNNTWDLSVTVSNADFVSVDTAGISGARQADGSLPTLNFMKLASTSDLINAGTDVGLDYDGSAPDLGAYEYSAFAEEPSAPYIATTTPYAITANSAKTGGYMISDGGGTISAKGICWATSANPDLTDNVISGGTGTADFTVTISGLTVNTIYHCRAYATNEVGTTYGANEQFTTSQSSIIKHSGKIVER